MSAHQTLLAEAVAHGLDEGWWAAKRRAVQPTKALLTHGDAMMPR